LSDRIKLTRKQVNFLLEHLDEKDPEEAATRFMELMILEKVDPVDIAFVIDKIIKRIEKK